ncbi:hypothetical protein N431DRAFT_485621 [Stipitochalara longipes BDJ]|nr:hypothetical protein N431DRAFT_485621 [Stipitochalara longipes BDJ]
MAGAGPSSPPSRAGYAIRASLACMPCRDRHRKCDARRPICSQCQVDDADCFYKKSRRGRFDQAILVQDTEQKKSKKGPVQRNQRVLKDTNVDRILELSAGSSSVGPAASDTPLQFSIKSSAAHHSQSAHEQDHVALNLLHGNFDYLPSESSSKLDWLGNPDILANGDIGISNYVLETDLQDTVIDQFDESSISELPETWQATSFSGTQEFSSSNITYPIGSTSRERGEDLVHVNSGTPQRSSMYNMNRNHFQPPYLGGSFPLAFSQIPPTSTALRVDLAPNGVSDMPLIVYGYGSWTATASNGSIESISLGYGLHEAHDSRKQKHIPTEMKHFHPPAIFTAHLRLKKIVFSNELRRHHASSLKGLQERIDLLHTPLDAGFVTTALDLLACIWQLLSIEVWRTTEGYWEMHWTALGTILSIMQPGYTKAYLPLQVSSNIKPYTRVQKPGRIDDALRRSPMSPDALVLKNYVQCYAWADILCCATFGLKRPFANPFQYLRLLEDGKLDLCSLMGCYNKVMAVILKIAIFKDWKETMQSSARLSLHELIDQSNSLEKDLSHELLKLLEERSRLTYQPEVDRSFVTELYIRSGLIYLHTVTSGPSIYIPEIREHVEKALKALLVLPCRLVLRISWPFCVAACMAVDEQQDQFRKIASNAIQAGYLIGTVVKGGAKAGTAIVIVIFIAILLVAFFYFMRRGKRTKVKSQEKSLKPNIHELITTANAYEMLMKRDLPEINEQKSRKLAFVSVGVDTRD